MKKSIILFILLTQFIGDINAETITGAFGGDYWRVSLARYETISIKDPAKEKIKNPISGKEVINNIIINSAILPISEIKGNLESKYNDCKNSTEAFTMCDKIKTNTDLKNMISNLKKLNIKNIPLDVIIEGINAINTKKETGGIFNDYPIFSYGIGSEKVSMYKFKEGNVMWVEKVYGGDSPSYYINNIKLKGDKLLYQQTELIPYMNLYNGVKDTQIESFLKSFDKNLKTAINNGFSFKNENFNKRFSLINIYFKYQEKNLTKKITNKQLSKNYKIENNTVKFLSTGVGDEQYLITDFDPNTIKIFDNGYSGSDKYGPFVYGTRLKGGDSKFFTLFKSSADYWGKTGSDKVYTYSNNKNGELYEISGASAKTLKYTETNFSSKNSLCKANQDWYLSYDAYDSKYCYGKPSNQDGVEILGNRR